MAEMIVQIGADVQPAIAGIKIVGDRLTTLSQKVAQFGGGVQRFIPPAISQFAKIPASVNQAAASLSKLPNASNAATASLVNLSRVAQDAPFGFIGIANNLNPLLESFQRLRATTGSTGGALKALGSSLTGAGGIGLALGVASSLLVVFGDRLFGAGKKAKEAKDNVDALSEASKNAFEGAGKEAAEVNSLIAVLNNETETRQRKLAAIKELQAIQPEVFANLKLEGNAVSGLDVAYKNYLENLRTVIAAKVRQAQIEQLITKQLQLQGATQTASEKGLSDAIKQIQDLELQKARASGGATGASIISTITGTREQRKKEIDQVQRDIEFALSELTQLSKGIKIDIEPAVKAKVDKKDIDFSPIGEPLKIQVPTEFEFLPTFKDIRIVLLGGDIKSLQEQAQDAINKGIEKLAKPFTLNLSVDAKLNLQKIEGLRALNEQLNKAISDGIQNINLEGLSSIGDAIGEAISGGDIQDAFSRFGQTVGTALQGIGRQIISIGVAALLAKKALEKLFTNPAIAIAAGVALVAAGGALKNVLSGGVKARKKGGPVKPGEPYLVGEEGPEIVSFERNGVVIPAPKTKRILQETDTVLPSIAPFDKVTAALPKREFGGPVLSNMRYIVGEKGGELYVPFASGSISRNKPSGLSGAFASSQETQYIPMIKNGELGLLIKRAEKFLGRNS